MSTQPNNMDYSIAEVGVRLHEQEMGWLNQVLDCMDSLELMDFPTKKQMVDNGYGKTYNEISDGMGWMLFKDVYSGRCN
jgi:hypothetical protein